MCRGISIWGKYHLTLLYGIVQDFDRESLAFQYKIGILSYQILIKFDMRSILPDRLGNSFPRLYQIHHLFVFSSVGRLLVPFLRELGLNCTEPQSDRTQGIVSTLIFFENIYLELFWLEEKSYPAQLVMATEFNFTARANWLETGASPFGFSLCCPAENANLFTSTDEIINTDRAPLSGQLPQFPPEKLTRLEEPICKIISDDVAIRDRLNRVLTVSENIVAQPLGVNKLTHVKIRVSSNRTLTTPLIDLATQNILDIEYRKSPLLELTFDDGNQKRYLDLRPLIPIILRY